MQSSDAFESIHIAGERWLHALRAEITLCKQQDEQAGNPWIVNQLKAARRTVDHAELEYRLAWAAAQQHSHEGEYGHLQIPYNFS
jgi:hypothetical protein